MKTPEPYTPIMLPLELLQINPDLATAYGRDMSSEELAILTSDIKDTTMLSPILVKPTTGDFYHILNGRHRLKAAKSLEWKYAPCYIIEESVAQQSAIFENITRRQLDHHEVSILQKLNQSTKDKARNIPLHLKAICEQFGLDRMLKGQAWTQFLATTEEQAQELLRELNETINISQEKPKSDILPPTQKEVIPEAKALTASHEHPSKQEQIIQTLKNTITNLRHDISEQNDKLKSSQASQESQKLETLEGEVLRLGQENRHFRETVSAYEVTNALTNSTQTTDPLNSDKSIPLALALIKDRIVECEKTVRASRLTLEKFWETTPPPEQRSIHAHLVALKGTCESMIKITAPDHPFTLVGKG